MPGKLDFSGLNSTLLPRAGEFLTQWAPGGRIVGREYCSGTKRGGPGDSFKCNIETGKWSDFATGESGGDMISLYACVENIGQGDAAKRLAEQVGFRLKDDPPPRITSHQLTRPPQGWSIGNMAHPKFGIPSAYWAYEDKESVLFFVARYETPEGKQFCPWSWSATASKWVAKGWPAPRPLYGLDLLAERPDAPVLICEGEKATEAARAIAGPYVCVCWPNGALAASKADWSVLKGRKVLIWPDQDEPGKAAGALIARILQPICPEVKVIDVSDRPKAWDAADAKAEGWDWKQLVAWAKPRAILMVKAETHAQAGPATAAAQVNLTVNMEADGQGTSENWAIWDEIGIACSGQGHPYCNVDNARRVLENHKPLEGLIWFDEFHQKFYTTWNSPKPRIWEDVDDINLCTYMQRNLGLPKMSIESVSQGARAYAKQHVHNEPKEWMESLKWDGERRINAFLADCFGVEWLEYAYEASKNFWVGMAARIYNPGCKLDNMLVLEGPQGSYKSTALEIIGGKWYLEMKESVQTKDFFLCLHGKLLVEIAELDSFSRADVTRIKQVISCRTDSYRAPYERATTDHPRMSVFAGTTNERNYLRDGTGARRFWPIKCNRVKLDNIANNREQLFAEAVHELKNGANWWAMPKDETERAQEERRQHDEWEGAICEWVEGRDRVTARTIAKDCLGVSLDKLDNRIQLRIGGIMRNLGWEKRRGESKDNIWQRPGGLL